MADLSVEDKSKGKRIITQFFRTMPAVQKSLMTAFDADGYTGISRVQNLLYPDHSSSINSIDTLRKSLSMILQHIYGMPVEDKEGYFQEILKCKNASQVIRKEKETLLNHFYDNMPALKQYLLNELLEDRHFRFITVLCQNFFEDEEKVSDMRSFKNQIRNLHDALAEQIANGTSEESLIAMMKDYKQSLEEELANRAQAASSPKQAGGEVLDGESKQKKQIILDTLNDVKYKDIKEFLIQKASVDPNFATFQIYLDNILAPSSRLVANNMQTFSEGVKKIKEFRDSLEKELLSG
jgi:hypothetical protein